MVMNASTLENVSKDEVLISINEDTEKKIVCVCLMNNFPYEFF